MLESESNALPLGDAPITLNIIHFSQTKIKHKEYKKSLKNKFYLDKINAKNIVKSLKNKKEFFKKHSQNLKLKKICKKF